MSLFLNQKVIDESVGCRGGSPLQDGGQAMVSYQVDPQDLDTARTRLIRIASVRWHSILTTFAAISSMKRKILVLPLT